MTQVSVDWCCAAWWNRQCRKHVRVQSKAVVKSCPKHLAFFTYRFELFLWLLNIWKPFTVARFFTTPLQYSKVAMLSMKSCLICPQKISDHQFSVFSFRSVQSIKLNCYLVFYFNSYNNFSNSLSLYVCIMYVDRYIPE